MSVSAPRTALTQDPPPHQARAFLRIVRHGAGPAAVYVLTYHRLDGSNNVSRPLLAEGAQPLLDLLDQMGVDFRSSEVRGALEDQSIRLVGRIEAPAEFEQIVIRRRGNELLRLGQVASVADAFAEQTSYSMRNGRPNVGLSVTRSREFTGTLLDAVGRVAAEPARW